MFGAGLLVGTALAVIIPEGVRSLVVESGAHANNVVSNAIEETHKHDQEHALSVIGYCLILGFIFMLIVDQVSIYLIIRIRSSVSGFVLLLKHVKKTNNWRQIFFFKQMRIRLSFVC